MIKKSISLVSAFIVGVFMFAVVNVSVVHALRTVESGCLDCHSRGSSVVPGRLQFQDGTSWHTTHRSESCSNCHPSGAGSTPIQVASCGSCHSTICGWPDFHENNVGQTCYDCHTECSPPACVPAPENCTDGMDNDCDGSVDCDDSNCRQDPACVVCVPSPENCTDGVDNDCDGSVDCDDSNCSQDPACVVCVPASENCTDGVDNDCDGVVDCEDSNCSQDPACVVCVPDPEDCTDGVDNDCDGSVDCDDRDCNQDPACVVCVPDPEDCTDGMDNDCDGSVDCDDRDCSQDPACVVCVPQAEDCTDGEDNDCDGLADCADPDCNQDAICSESPSDDFSAYCASCHGIDGSGGIIGEDIRGRSDREIRRAIRKEREMKFLRFLTRAQIQAIADFLSADKNDPDDDERDDDERDHHDRVYGAVSVLDDSIDLGIEAEDVMLSGDIEVIKQLIRNSNDKVTEAVNTIATVWVDRKMELIVPTAVLQYAKIINNVILYRLLSNDEQWRRELAKNSISISIDLCEYAKNLIEG